MNDDWRVRVDLHEGRKAFELARRLEAAELGHEVRSELGDRVAVSHDGAEVFCYAGAREAAAQAEALISQIARDEGWVIDTELRRWHPVAEEWEDPDAPLPSEPNEVESEHAELIEHERAEQAYSGEADFEVRVECASHEDARALSERLGADGLRHVRRWKYLVIGATDEDDARRLAEQVQSQSPAGSVVRTEASERLVRETLPTNPFAIFGGLGG